MTISRVKTWTAGQVLSAVDLNAEFDNVLTGLNAPSVFSIIATGSTTARSLATRFAEHIDVRDEGAVGDGVTNDRQAFVDTDADTTGPITCSEGTYVIGSNLTITSPVLFMGGILKPSSGVTVTLSGGVIAANQKIFDLSAGGTIVLQNTENFIPHWWGAVGDGVADDTVAIQAAITAAPERCLVVFPNPTSYYLTTITLSITKSVRLVGLTVGQSEGNPTIRTFNAIDVFTVNPAVSVKVVQFENLTIQGGTNGLNYTWTGYLDRSSYIRNVNFLGQTNAAIKSVTGMIGTRNGPINISGSSAGLYGMWFDGDQILNASQWDSVRVVLTTTAAIRINQPNVSVAFSNPIIESNLGRGFHLIGAAVAHQRFAH